MARSEQDVEIDFVRYFTILSRRRWIVVRRDTNSDDILDVE